MQTPNFPTLFEALTGAPPFPWQRALFQRFIDGNFPSSASIPTGLGKTSTVAIWLIALSQQPDHVPRRIVYVVNRRTVVDQTTAEVEKWRARLQSDSPELRDVRDRLAALRAIPSPATSANSDSPLAVSTLRGQFADNREWSADPARPAVIVGTVDMIGSRLLFSGYTIGFKTRPHHAGLLAQDTLLVHDEAHLEPAFQKLLENLSAAQFASADPRKLRILELTATSRIGDTDGGAKPFGLDENPEDKDTENEIVRKRFNAVKRIALVALGDKEKPEAKLAALAKEKPKDRAVIVFARSVETAVKVAAELDKGETKGKVAILTGTMRGKERDELATISNIFQRFLPPSDRSREVDPANGSVFLVATSAGEVGVNLSADDLVCDLSTYESMAQRFGRVNRFGDRDDSTITVVYEPNLQAKYDEGLAKVKNASKDAAKKVKAYETKNKITISLLNTLELLRRLEPLNNGVGDASPAALDALPSADRAAAFSPLPEMRVATAVQFDAWALTSIREPLAARPPVAPYLHGEAEWEPPETHIAWREEVQRLAEGALLENYPPEELLEDFPIKPRELLRDTTERICDFLIKLVAAHQKNGQAIPDAWLVLDEGKVEPFFLKSLLTDEAPEEGDADDDEANDDEGEIDNTAGWTDAKDAAKRRKARLVARLADRTLILPPSFGGLSAQGFLSIAAGTESADVVLDVSSVSTGANHEPERIRRWSDTPKIPAEFAVAYRLVRVIDTKLGSEGFSDKDSNTDEFPIDLDSRTSRVSRYWLWLEAKTAAGVERRFSASSAQPETLAAHTRAVVGHARAIAEKLLPIPANGAPDLRRCLTVAAELHDLGKNRAHWQRNLGNRDELGIPAFDVADPDSILAKSAPGMRPRNVAEHYRHEFGSLTDARDSAGFSSLNGLERDIVLHLVAAHHGRARPHFPGDEIFDPTPGASPEESAALAKEIPRRFARLQHRFGRWGLAWLESLLRAADYAASAGIAPHDKSASDAQPKALCDETKTDAEEAPAPSPAATISLRLNPANPGHYFACCGLFELAAALAPEAQSWFVEDGSAFHIAASGLSLRELLTGVTEFEIKALDSEDRPLTPIEISFAGGDAIPITIRIDWWRREGGLIGKLKPWAGQMSVRAIADDMREALKRELAHCPLDSLEEIFFLSSTTNDGEPFYFDANRTVNAKAQDVGFSVDKLKKGSVKIASAATPVIELLCLVGLQRARPLLAVNERGKEREYDYHLWHFPLPLPPIAAAVAGLLPDSNRCYRFSNPSRAKDYRAFAPAIRIS